MPILRLKSENQPPNKSPTRDLAAWWSSQEVLDLGPINGRLPAFRSFTKMLLGGKKKLSGAPTMMENN